MLYYSELMNLVRSSLIHLFTVTDTVSAHGTEARENELSLFFPAGIFFQYGACFICLRKFQRISGEIDETVTHVSLWKFLKFLNNSTETYMPLIFFPNLRERV